jgi:hypothetical protein
MTSVVIVSAARSDANEFSRVRNASSSSTDATKTEVTSHHGAFPI